MKFINFLRCCHRKGLSRLSYVRCISVQAYSNNLNNILISWPGIYRLPVNAILHEISIDVKCEKQAKSCDIDSKSWSFFISSFRRKLMKEPLESFHHLEGFISFLDIMNKFIPYYNESNHDSNQIMDDLPYFRECKDFLFNNMIDVAEKTLHHEIAANRALCSMSDLRVPHMW